MQHYKRILAFLLVVMLFITGLSTVWAAENVTAEAGETVSLTFSFIDVYDVEGTFAVSDPDKILKNHAFKIVSSGATSVTVTGSRLRANAGSEPRKTTVIVALEGVLAEDAEEGQNCTVSFNGTCGDGNKAYGTKYSVYDSATIRVKAALAEEDGPSESDASQSATEVQDSNEPMISRTDLETQIGIAEGLDVTKYTKASGDALTKALSKARTAVKSEDQNKIDAATVTLKSAINGMKKMDYAGLNQALSDAKGILEVGELTDLGIQLEEAIKMGSGLLTSRDQVAVDTAVSHIEEVMMRIDAILGELKSPEIIEVEVPVEVPPTDDYCNIPNHKLWPVLLFFSAALNVVLAAVIVVYTVKKRKYQNDDTPLVEYDIEDDF